MDKYAPEVLLGLLAILKDITLIVACAWTVASLYRLSGSWHCLWALLMLFFLGRYRFVRD